MTALTILGQKPVITLIILYLSGFCDIIDGIVARESKSMSSVGTLLDIVFDRIVEMSILGALAYTYPQYMPIIIILLMSILFCITVFLTIGILVQKSSHKTFFYVSGIMERTEAFILFTLLIIFPRHIPVIGIIGALLIFITGIQRFVFAIKHLDNPPIGD
ncbi:MAG: CDP-alcohol phosphatidyltransferase family protein [Brevinema sp.]